MACGARLGLKQRQSLTECDIDTRLNGLGRPFGFETLPGSRKCSFYFQPLLAGIVNDRPALDEVVPGHYFVIQINLKGIVVVFKRDHQYRGDPPAQFPGGGGYRREPGHARCLRRLP